MTVNEHYCRHWSAPWMLSAVQARHAEPSQQIPLVHAQYDQDTYAGERVFSIALAAPDQIEKGVAHAFLLAFEADAMLSKVINFVKDPTIRTLFDGLSCERCSLTRDVCTDRVAPPIVYDRALAVAEEEQAIRLLGDSG
jgi:hypothetical protein